MKYAILGLAAIAGVALTGVAPAYAQTARECVTFEQGMNNIARLAKEADWRVGVIHMSPEDTAKFYEAIVSRGMAGPENHAYRIAFIVVDREPGTVGALLYGEDGCVWPNQPSMPAALFNEIMAEIFGENWPALVPVRFTRSI